MKASTLSLDKCNLKSYEAVIERGKQSFVEVGLALASIKSQRLWQPEFISFEVYCQKRWGWGKSYCYELINGAEAVKSLPEKVSTMVENQRTAREIAKVPAAKREAVLEKAAAAGPVTAKSIKAAAQPTIDVESTTEPENPGVRTRDQELADNAASEPECPTHETVDVVDGWLRLFKTQVDDMISRYPDRYDFICSHIQQIVDTLEKDNV